MEMRNLTTRTPHTGSADLKLKARIDVRRCKTAYFRKSALILMQIYAIKRDLCRFELFLVLVTQCGCYLHISNGVFTLPDTFWNLNSKLRALLLKKDEVLLALMLFAAAGAKLLSLSNCGPRVVVFIIFSSSAEPLRFEIIILGLGAEAVT